MLGDIEIAQKLLEGNTATESAATVDHPDDVNYQSLHCKLKVMDRTSDEFKVVTKYLNETMGTPLKLMEAWALDREGEGARFSEHDSIANRKLLWHGTSTAVLVAILRSGAVFDSCH